jgi:hypothetical protein
MPLESKIDKELKKAEEEMQFEDDSNEIPPKDVFTFNELRSCADLYRLNESHILDIQPYYQRDIVWPNTSRTKFIDSLLKRLPIPSLCFSLDSKTNKMQVIDGLQRISTICTFFTDDSWVLADLEDVDRRIKGKSVKQIREDDPEVIQSIENVALPVTLLRCDHSNPHHSEYIFTIFRRLNTGGMKLTNQEIRNAVYSGSFNDFLISENLLSSWASLLKKTISQSNIDNRFSSVELILKTFAFYDKLTSYKGRLNVFLNEYMQEHRKDTEGNLLMKKELLARTCGLMDNHMFPRKVPTRLSSVVFETLVYAIAKNINSLEELPEAELRKFLKNQYQSLLSDDTFSSENIRQGIYKRQKVIDRLNTAERYFSRKHA